MELWMLAFGIFLFLVDYYYWHRTPDQKNLVINLNYTNLHIPNPQIIASDETNNKKITYQFNLYTPINRDEEQIISLNPSNITESYFDFDAKTYFIIYGVNRDYIRPEIIYKLKQGIRKIINIKSVLSVGSVLLENEDANVVIVNWLNPSYTNSYYPSYFENVNNTIEVGYYLSEFLILLRNNSMDLKNVHIFGFGLSAHIAGIAGYFVNGQVGRITGFSPNQDFLGSQIVFEVLISTEFEKGSNSEKFVHDYVDEFDFIGNNKWKILDKTDAHFVDIIHTSYRNSYHNFDRLMGHADFYSNRKISREPGCTYIHNIDLCNNERSLEYYIESINRTRIFEAQRCDIILKVGCSEEIPVQMGHYLSEDARGIYYVNTNYEYPFSKGHFFNNENDNKILILDRIFM